MLAWRYLVFAAPPPSAGPPPAPQPTTTEAPTEPSPRPMNFFLDNLPLLKIPLLLI